MTKEKIIAIIPARGGSKSIPRKNVLPFRGKPLVAWPIELAKSVSRIDRVILSSDDDEIMAIGQKYGAEVLFKRPVELATDEIATVPVLRHCLDYLKNSENYQPDIVLLLYATAPLLKKARVEEALDLFEKTNCNSVISVVKDWGKFWRKSNNGCYQPFYPENRQLNRQYFDPLYREDGAIYFTRAHVLLEQGKMIDENKVEFIIMEEAENIDIDEKSDLEKVKKL